MFKKFVSLSLLLSLSLTTVPQVTYAGGSTATVDVDNKTNTVMAGADDIQIMKFTVSPSAPSVGALELKAFTLFCENGETLKNIWVNKDYTQYDQLRYNNLLDSNTLRFSLNDELVVSTGSKTFEVYANLTTTQASYTASCELVDMDITRLSPYQNLSEANIFYQNNNTSVINVLASTDSNNNDDYENNDEVNPQSDPSWVAVDTFYDINPYTSYYNSIEWLRLNGIANGYQDGSFRPYECVNRVEFLKLIFEANGSTVYDYNGPLFWDTNHTSWYSDYLGTALNKGIVNGYPDGSFKPYNCVSRSEAIKMAVIEFYGHVYGPPAYNLPNDLEQNKWYSPYTNFAFARGLVGTMHMIMSPEGAYYLPAQAMTRAEVAELIYRIANSKVVAYY